MEGTGASNSVNEVNMDLDSRMDDPNIEAIIVEQLKAQGIFDKFRKDCLADADTKPAYQNLKHRVDAEVNRFLKNREWNPTLNRNALRNQLRSYMQGMDHSSGVDRIVEQLVNPELTGRIMPEVENVIKDMFGNPLTQEEITNGIQNEIVENGCDQMENGEIPSSHGADDVDMDGQGGTEDGAQRQVPMSLRPGMIPPPPPPDAHSASSNGGDSSPGLAGQISPLTPGRDSGEGGSISPTPAPNSPSVAAGDISPLTPTRGGDISPLTPPAPPPQENSHDIPAVGAEGEVAMEVDSHTPPGSPPTPSFTPPLPRNSFIPPHPVPMRRPLTPHTPPLPLPPIPPAALDLESGGEASMSSISDGDMPDVSPPRQSPRSPSSSNDEDAAPRGPHRRMQVPGDDSQLRSGASDISDTELPSVGSDRPDSAASADRAASKESGEAVSDERGGSAASAVPSTPPGEATSVEDDNLELLEEERKRLMAKLEQDFHLSPESESEGEYHSDEDDEGDQDNSEEVKKSVTSNEESNPPQADMSPVSEGSISVTPVPAIADPSSRPVSTEPLSSSSSLPDSPRAPSREAPRTDALSSGQPDASLSPSRHSVSPQSQASNISPNQLLRMRTLPLPAAKSLNTAQVLKTLPFPEGEGRPPPPEVETSRRGPQTPPPPPCEPWDRPRGPRTPEPQFSPERKSRTPSPDSEPLYYEQQTRSPTSPPSPPTAFGRRGPRTPPLPPSSPPPSSSFERLELSEESRSSDLQSGCKPFEPTRRDSRDSDGGGGSGGRSGGVEGAPPSGGAPVASGSTESKAPVAGSTSETVPTSKTHLPTSSRDKTEKKKALITKQQNAKIEKYDKKIKTNEKIKSDKFLDLDIFSTVKTPKTPHVPHRKPQDSGQKSPLISGAKTPTSSRTSSSSKTLDYNNQKDKDKKGKSDEPFLKPGKIPDRRSSSDIRKESDGKSSSRDHESRSSSGKDKERRSSTSSDKEREKPRSKDGRDKDRGRDSKERERDRHKDRHGKDKEREKTKDRDSKEREREKHKERDKSKSERHREKSEGEKSRKNSGEVDSKKIEKLDKEKGTERSKNEKHGEKSEDDIKKVKSRKESGEDDKKKAGQSDEYANNIEEAKQKLAAFREKKEKEEKERKKKIELEKKEERARRKQLEKEKEAQAKKELLNMLNGLDVKDIKKLVEKVKGGESVSKAAKKMKPVISDDDSEEDGKLERRRSKSGETSKTETKSPSSEKLSKRLSHDKNSKKKIVVSDDDSSDDSSEDEDVKQWIEKNRKNKSKSEDSVSPSSASVDSPGRSTRSQIIKSMRERPVKVNVDKSLTKNIDVSWFNKGKKDSLKTEMAEENTEKIEKKINENENIETGVMDKNENNVVIAVDQEREKENEKIEIKSHSKELINESIGQEKHVNSEVTAEDSEKGVVNASKRRPHKGRSRKASTTPEDVSPAMPSIAETGSSKPSSEHLVLVADDNPIRDGYDQVLRDEEKSLISSTEDDDNVSLIPKLVSHLAARNLDLKDVQFPLEQEINAKQDKTRSTNATLDKSQTTDTIKPQLQDPAVEVDNPESPSVTKSELQSPGSLKSELQSPGSLKSELQSPGSLKSELQSPGPVKQQELQSCSAGDDTVSTDAMKDQPGAISDHLEAPVETKDEIQSPGVINEDEGEVASPVVIQEKPEPHGSVKDELQSKGEIKEDKLDSPMVSKDILESSCVIKEDKLAKPSVIKEDKLVSPNVTQEEPVSPSVTKEKLVSPSVTKDTFVSPSAAKETFVSPSATNETFISPSVNKETFVSPSVNKETLVSLSVSKETFTSPEKRGKKRSSGAKWDCVLEPIPVKPAPKTKIEKQLLINNGAVDYLESARGSAKRPRKANVKYSEEFTTVDSDEEVSRSLSKPSPARSSTAAATSSSSIRGGSKRQAPSETVVTPKKDSVITPPKPSTDISPSGTKRTSSTQIIRKYMASAGVERPLEEKSHAGSISSPEYPANKVNAIRANKVTQKLAKDKKETESSEGIANDISNIALADTKRQLDSEIAATDKEIDEIKSFLLSKRRKRRASAQKSRASKELNNPSAWNTILKDAIKKVKTMKQASNVERIGGVVRRSQASLKDVSDDVLEKKLDDAAKQGVFDRIDKQRKVTYRIAVRGSSSNSTTESTRISFDDLDSSKSSSVDLNSSRLSSEDQVSYHKTAIIDSSDNLEDLHGFSSKEIHEPKRILHFDTFDRLESSGAKVSSLDELEGVSLNDDLLKSDDEEFLKSSNLEVIFSPELQTYINNLKKLEREHLDTVKNRGKSVGKSQEFVSDESDDKGSSSPESFGSSKENQPAVSGIIVNTKRNQNPHKFIQEATRKRRSGLKEGQSLKTRKVS